MRGRQLAGTYCPQPFVWIEDLQTRLDEVLGDCFAILSAVPPTPAVLALADALDARVIDVRALKDDGVLGGWLRTGRADAVLLRPDRVVVDIVPAGADTFTDAATWAPLLCTGRRAADPTSESTTAAALAV
jgi:3-(3-hydroxy-phenyl)propionate hydroxylase